MSALAAKSATAASKLLCPTDEDDSAKAHGSPKGWIVRPLADLAQIRTGIAKNSNEVKREPVQVYYLRVANVQDGYLDLSEMAKLTISREDVQKYQVLPGDMLMNEGGDRDKLGRGALWAGEFSPCVHQNHVFVVRCTDKLDPNYLSAFTAGAAAKKYFLLAGRQTTNLASINKTSLGQLPVALPASIAEQQVIAEALTDADALIKSLEQLIAKKRAIKRGAMQELLTGQRRLPGSKGEWKQLPIGQLATVQRGASPRPIDNPKWFDNNSEVGWVRISDVTSSSMFLDETAQRLTQEGIANSRPVPKNSLIMSICATVGRPIITHIDTCIHDGFVVLGNLGVDQTFLYHALAFIEADWIKHGQTGSQMNLNTALIENTRIRVPDSQAEQSAVAAVLSDMDDDLIVLGAKLSKARHLQRGMMQELLTGRIRLP